MPHVAGAPAGTHPISNSRFDLNPAANQARVLVEIGGTWYPVATNSADELLLVMTVLQSPFIGVNNGWLVGSRR